MVSNGGRAVLMKVGRAKLCGLLFVVSVASTWLGVYLGGGRNGFTHRLMILASAVLAPLAVFILEWVFEVDRGSPPRAVGNVED